MARKPKKERVVKQWELSDEMRAWFIEKGWDTNNQFKINIMMRGVEAIKRLPCWEERLRMYAERDEGK